MSRNRRFLVDHGMWMTCPARMRSRIFICGFEGLRLTPNRSAMPLRVSHGGAAAMPALSGQLKPRGWPAPHRRTGQPG